MRLLAAAVFGVRRQGVPALHRYMGDAAQALRSGPQLPLDQELLVREKRVLLHRLNLIAPPSPVDWAVIEAAIRAFDPAANGEPVNDLVRCVNALTGFGVAPQERPVAAIADEASALLRGLAAHFLRQYDLAAAARVARALNYLESCREGRAPNGLLNQVLDSLLLQQRPEGCFGFYGPSEGAALAALPAGSSLDVSLYLPITVECLWTLAEGTVPGWRLFDSFRA